MNPVEEHKAFQVVVTQYVWIGLVAGWCLVSKSPLKAQHKQETGALGEGKWMSFSAGRPPLPPSH